MGCQSLMRVLISLLISHNAGVLLSLRAYPCHLSGDGADSINSHAGWVATSLACSSALGRLCWDKQHVQSDPRYTRLLNSYWCCGPCWLVPGRPCGLGKCWLHPGTAFSGTAPAGDAETTCPSPKRWCCLGLCGFGCEGTCLVCLRVGGQLLWASWCLQWLIPVLVEWGYWGSIQPMSRGTCSAFSSWEQQPGSS